jgi:hypothetical protein
VILPAIVKVEGSGPGGQGCLPGAAARQHLWPCDWAESAVWRVVREFAITTDNQPAGLCHPELRLDVCAQDALLDLAGSCHGQG